jgi:acetylornithine deacetylase/succinyl-diaminopimelate desuccinylase-like protein
MKNSYLDDACALLSRLIQNKCVNPPGDEMASIRTVEGFLTERGIECQVFESAPNRGNLVAKIKGSNPDSTRLMFGPSHVDVVPADNPDDWDGDPFSGEIKDGYIWGRGALDMLFTVAAQVLALVKLHDEQFKPKGDLILLLVADEEAGGHHGAGWMVKNHWDLIAADYAVTESGGFSIIPGKILFVFGEKGAAWKRISFKGTPGHGSLPYASDNAVEKASQAVSRLREYGDVKIPLTTEFLSPVAKGLSQNTLQRFMLTNTKILPYALKKLKGKSPDMAKSVHSLTRMTMSPNMIEGGVKTNVIPAQASINVDVRTLPGQDDAYVLTHIKRALGDLADQATIEPLSPEEGGVSSSGNASPADSEFVRKMERVIQRQFPDAALVPFMLMGATDARFLRDKGTEAYGFGLFDPQTPLNHLVELAHGTDERVSIKTVELTLNAHYDLAKEVLEG